MADPIVHIEFAGVNGAQLESFYRDLFGWSINRENVGGFPYGRINFGASELTGGIRHEPEGKAELVIYVGVEDLATSFAKAQELGGSVLIPPMETPEVTFALIADPEGNPIGLVQNR